MEIGYNTHNARTGAPMKVGGMRGSFVAFLEQSLKGHMVEGVSPMTDTRKAGEFFAFAGGPTKVWFHRISGDAWRFSIRRPNGRGGVAIGTTVVERVGTFRCPTDPREFFAAIGENVGATLTIEPLTV
tara:strand:+ start:276 stop:659 length:384 start_codon:yes stop_codon:yes gene_type:complete